MREKSSRKVIIGPEKKKIRIDDLDALWEAYKRFVAKRANKFCHQFRNININDLINEGFFGLRKAALRYDPEKGFEFITYAKWWIDAKMFSFCYANSYALSIPAKIHQAYVRYMDWFDQKDLEEDKMCEKEIAIEIGVTTTDLVTALELFGGLLNACDGELAPVENLPVIELESKLLPLMRAILPETHFYLVYHHHVNEIPLSDLGRYLGWTREYARQIHDRSMITLKHFLSKIYKEYV